MSTGVLTTYLLRILRLLGIVDACGPVLVGIVDAMEGTGCGEDTLCITSTYTLTDGVTTISCSEVYKVVDDIIPTISCPPSLTLSCESQVPSPSIASVTASDNCSSVTVSFDGDALSNMTCENEFMITRTYEAVDGCANRSTCTQTILVSDNTPPSISCLPNITVTCIVDIPAANTAAINTSDGCGGTITVTVAPDITLDGICENQFSIQRVYTAVDLCGNIASMHSGNHRSG